MVSRVGAFTVRTFYFLTSNAKVTYAPGYESLCTIRENWTLCAGSDSTTDFPLNERSPNQNRAETGPNV